MTYLFLFLVSGLWFAVGWMLKAYFVGEREAELTAKAELARAAFHEQVIRHGYIDGTPRVAVLRLVQPGTPGPDDGVKN